jgi:hypothetical protein
LERQVAEFRASVDELMVRMGLDPAGESTD